MSRPGTKGEPLTLEERGRDSRDAMEWRELCVVEIGERITDPDQPRRATLRRWLIADADLRERYAAAVDGYRMRAVEAAIEQADRDVEHARGRRRVAAMRRQVIARTQWLKLIAANAECEEENAPDGRVAPHPFKKPDGRVAPRPFKNEGRGISDEGVAILQNAAERFAAPAPSNDDASGGVSEPQRDSPLLFSEAIMDDVAAERTSLLVPPDTSPAPSSDNADDDSPSYAPEDARYRAPQRERDETSDAPPPAPDAAPPALADVELDEDGEPRFHRLPLTVGEEEALKARLAGLPPPKPEPEPEFDRYGNRIRRDPPGTWTVRFDLDATPQRRETMADYDPFK
jgi:hypothetical protein